MKNFFKYLFQATVFPFLFVVILWFIFFYPLETYLRFLGNFVDESYVDLVGVALLLGIYYLYIKFKN